MRKKISTNAIITIGILLLVVLLMDIWMMYGQIKQQTKDAGLSQLDSISRQLEKKIDDAKNETLSEAIKVREVLDDRKVLEKFLYDERDEIIKGDTGA
jgi:uncharacterized protein YpmB